MAHQNVEPLIFCEVCKDQENPLRSFYRYEPTKGFFVKVKIIQDNFFEVKDTPFSFICEENNKKQVGCGAFSICCKRCLEYLKHRDVIHFRHRYGNFF